MNAEQLATNIATSARTAWTDWAAMRTGDPAEAATLAAAMYGHGLAHLLKTLTDHLGGEQADAVAARLQQTWAADGGIDDDLRQWTRRQAPVVNTCVTCELPEDRWPASHPLYAEGSRQCPDCTRHDLNDEATRKHDQK